MRHHGRERSAAALLALTIQALLVGFLRLSRESDRSPGTDVADLILIQPIQLPVAEKSPISKSSEAIRTRKPPVTPRTNRTERAPPAEPGSAITTPPVAPPPVDWSRALEDSARRIVQQQADREQHGEPLDSKPPTLAMPRRVDPTTLPGAITQLPNGDVMVQLDDGWYCIYSAVPLAEQFDVWARNRPPKCTKKGGDEEPFNLDAAKPGYLRRPLPEPKPPPTDAGR
jgi:hypothetical protein